MGTHPIFESDFDCLTVLYCKKSRKTLLEERLEEIRKIGIKMSERLRLQEEFSNEKPGLLKFAKTARSNTTVLQKRGIKKAKKFSSDRRAGKLRSFESGFCEDIEENRNPLKLKNENRLEKAL